MIGHELRAMARVIHADRLEDDEADAVERLAERLEAKAVELASPGDRAAIMALSLALARLYSQRAMISGQPAGVIGDLVFDCSHYVARIAATLIDQRRTSERAAQRKLGK